jgi:hypothetical protein
MPGINRLLFLQQLHQFNHHAHTRSGVCLHDVRRSGEIFHAVRRVVRPELMGRHHWREHGQWMRQLIGCPRPNLSGLAQRGGHGIHAAVACPVQKHHQRIVGAGLESLWREQRVTVAHAGIAGADEGNVLLEVDGFSRYCVGQKESKQYQPPPQSKYLSPVWLFHKIIFNGFISLGSQIKPSQNGFQAVIL